MMMQKIGLKVKTRKLHTVYLLHKSMRAHIELQWHTMVLM